MVGIFIFLFILCIQYMILVNSFDTEPMAKIAVKMSIMRVVKFMSSPGNDFMSWQKMSATLIWRPVRGPSTEPTLIPLVTTRWLLGTFNVRNKIQKLLMFGELWQPLVSKVTWMGSPVWVRSWDTGVLCCHAHPRCCPANTVRDGQSKLEKGQFLVCGWGGTTPNDPH